MVKLWISEFLQLNPKEPTSFQNYNVPGGVPWGAPFLQINQTLYVSVNRCHKCI